MHLGKAADALWNMVNDGEPNDLVKLTKASVLLDAFDRAARDTNGNVEYGDTNILAREARIWLEIVCGVGDGGWDDQIDQAIENARAAVYKLQSLIEEDGFLRGP